MKFIATKPTLTEAQLKRLTEMAELAASEVLELDLMQKSIDNYLQQCYYPDVDPDKPLEHEGYNDWIRAKFIDLFAMYLHCNLNDQARGAMANAVQFFNGAARKETECGCGVVKGFMRDGQFFSCMHVGPCSCKPIPHPDHDQRAEGLGDGNF